MVKFKLFIFKTFSPFLHWGSTLTQFVIHFTLIISISKLHVLVILVFLLKTKEARTTEESSVLVVYGSIRLLALRDVHTHLDTLTSKSLFFYQLSLYIRLKWINLHLTTFREGLVVVLSPFYIWGNWNLEWLSPEHTAELGWQPW